MLGMLDTILQYDHVNKSFEVLPQTLRNGGEYISAVESSLFPACGWREYKI
jgi:hypothetical protein